MKVFIAYLYKHRFELFIATQFFILFGSLFFPDNFFQLILLPALFILNIASGILLVSKKKKTMWFLIILIAVAIIAFGNSLFMEVEKNEFILMRLSVYFIFYIIVTLHTIEQVWHEKKVDKTVIIGLMSGYISLGFLAFFMLLSIELVESNSFTGILLDGQNLDVRFDSLMYYAYITLLTIGYGDIIPVTPIAQKAVVLIGLIGQFYVIIITSVVVAKYINVSVIKNND
ncbi:ion channel [uncultured Kordia sp.]|uniref:ion channel n=1 Tax=uncultured Kordia sp. TaxID=507699 RepID=UPI002630518E|nr:ion channel [uncultured Kordia sp.]